jgi:hypothetical protein
VLWAPDDPSAAAAKIPGSALRACHGRAHRANQAYVLESGKHRQDSGDASRPADSRDAWPASLEGAGYFIRRVLGSDLHIPLDFSDEQGTNSHHDVAGQLVRLDDMERTGGSQAECKYA